MSLLLEKHGIGLLMSDKQLKKEFGVLATSQTRIREVSVWNIGHDVGYPERVFYQSLQANSIMVPRLYHSLRNH